jgi:hypothetical protein
MTPPVEDFWPDPYRAIRGQQLMARSVLVQHAGNLGDIKWALAAPGRVNAIGRMDAVIHNAGIYTASSRGSTPEGMPPLWP